MVTGIRAFWLVFCLIYIALEIRLARNIRSNREAITVTERVSERILWLSFSLSLLSALWFKQLAFFPIAIGYLPRQLIALLVILAGLVLRFMAIKTLGKFFTTQVTIHDGHRLIKAGPYRYVRHPAYTGLLIAFAGAGLAMGDLVALALLTLVPLFAINYRITLEEKLLLGEFGSMYQDYCRQTKKLIPWLY